MISLCFQNIPQTKNDKTSMVAAKEAAIAFDRQKYKHYFWVCLIEIKEYFSLLCVMCRIQGVLSFKNIHIGPHERLKAMFTSNSAVLCTVEILQLLFFLIFEHHGLQCCRWACIQRTNIHLCWGQRQHLEWQNLHVPSKPLGNCYFISINYPHY